jgi:folylpolyglutamate synthase
VLERNKAEDIKATEFELLTATAFDIFTRENVQVGIIEVGMGGRDDATNILKTKALTIITKMGLDHQGFLGNTIEEITKVKCGIFKKGVPVLYSHSNDPSVIDVIKAEAAAVGAGPLLCPKVIPSFKYAKYKTYMKGIVGRRAQKVGIATAYGALKVLEPVLPDMIPVYEGAYRGTKNIHPYEKAILNTTIPGRMQYINLEPFTGVSKTAILDGAHNPQAAEYLDHVVGFELRDFKYGPVTWVIANTKGKDLPGFLQSFVRHYDSVATVEFGPVDGMPWIEPASSEDIANAVRELHPNVPLQAFGRDIEGAIKWAVQDQRQDAPVVICGSLYLVSDVLRRLRDEGNKKMRENEKIIRRIGRSRIKKQILQLPTGNDGRET